MIRSILITTTIALTLSLGLTTAYGLTDAEKQELEILEEILNPINNNKGKATILIYSNTEWSGSVMGSDLSSGTREGYGDSKFHVDCTIGSATATIQKGTADGYLIISIIQYADLLKTEYTIAQYGVVSIGALCHNEREYKENIDDYKGIENWKDRQNDILNKEKLEKQKLEKQREWNDIRELTFNVTLSFNDTNIGTTLSGKTLEKLEKDGWTNGTQPTNNLDKKMKQYYENNVWTNKDLEGKNVWQYELSNSKIENKNGHYILYDGNCKNIGDYDYWTKTWTCNLKIHEEGTLWNFQ